MVGVATGELSVLELEGADVRLVTSFLTRVARQLDSKLYLPNEHVIRQHAHSQCNNLTIKGSTVKKIHVYFYSSRINGPYIQLRNTPTSR
jgi:hypothetical protein